MARWFKRKLSTRRDIIQKSDITKLCAFTYYPMVFVKYTFLCNDSWPHTKNFKCCAGRRKCVTAFKRHEISVTNVTFSSQFTHVWLRILSKQQILESIFSSEIREFWKYQANYKISDILIKQNFDLSKNVLYRFIVFNICFYFI